MAGSSSGLSSTSIALSNRAGGTSAQSTTRKHEGDRRPGGDFRSRGEQHLSYSDMMDQKARGLCFRCGERFHPLHKCADRHLRVIILGDDEEMNEIGEASTVEGEEGKEEETLECKAIGLCGITGNWMVKTPLGR